MEMLPAKVIILGGLSNGCAMSLMTLLSLDLPVSAYIGMSGHLPFRSDIEDVLRNADAPEDDMFGEEDATESKSKSAQALDFARVLLSLDAVNAKAAASANPLLTPVFLGHGAR